MKRVYLLPLILVFFLPLIVFEKALILKGELKNFWIGWVNFDYFSYYKGRVLLILVLFGLISLLYKLRQEDVKVQKDIIYYPMGIYVFFAVLSTALSKYKNVSILGFPDRYEGVAILISYIILMLLFMALVKKQDAKLMINSFFASSIVIGIIGFFQFLRVDIVKSYILSKLISFQMQYIGKVIIDFKPEDRAAYATLYNSNYMGSYMALAFVLSFICYVLASKDKKITYGLISTLMYFNLIGSHSRAGILGSIVAISLFLIIRYKDVLRNKKSIPPIVAIYIVIFIFINTLSGNYIKDKIGSLFVDINNTFAQEDVDTGLRDIKINGNKLSFIFGDGSLNFTFSSGGVKITDEVGRDVKFEYDDSKMEVVPKESKYKKLKYYLTFNEGNPGVTINNGWQSLTFIKTNEAFKLLSNSGRLININSVEKVDFNGKEKLGSSRMYIWSRSLPLIKNTIFIGYGPDTYAMFYPQYDYIGKYIAFGTAYIIVDKPHNMYIQNAINIGVMGLFALMLIFIFYIIKGRKAILHRLIDEDHILGIGIYFAIISYLIAGIFNDSVVSVAPVFWALLGIGYNSIKEVLEEIRRRV